MNDRLKKDLKFENNIEILEINQHVLTVVGAIW